MIYNVDEKNDNSSACVNCTYADGKEYDSERCKQCVLDDINNFKKRVKSK